MATDYHDYPVPLGTASPFVHLDIKALADAVDKDVPVVVADVAAMNALTPLADLKVNVKSLNGKQFIYDGTTWKTDRLFVPVVQTDTNWAYYGGMYVDFANPLAPMVDLRLRLQRLAAGGTINLTSSFLQAFAGFIPSPYRPNNMSVTDTSVIQTSTGTDKWGAVFSINKTGDLLIRTDSGSSTIVASEYLFLRSSWVA